MLEGLPPNNAAHRMSLVSDRSPRLTGTRKRSTRSTSRPNSNTPRALNYRGYAVALDPNYPQVRKYRGGAYVIEGKYDLAKAQLSTIEKLCSKDCEYYEDLAEALTQAHAL
jgi:predicted Zn-dependent protease